MKTLYNEELSFTRFEKEQEMKSTLRKGLLYLSCCIVTFGKMGCGSSQQQEQKPREQAQQEQKGRNRYLKYNLHYYARGNSPEKLASVVNYTESPGHGFYPYGTLVTVGSHSKGFKLRVQETGDVIYLECREAHIGNKRPSEYLVMLISPTPVSYTGLSAVDQKGISDGRPYTGMSKKGIMIALGYPAPVATPSPDADEWHYWKSRFVKRVIHFTNGRVDRIN